jgi:hypothetical protein
MRSTSESGMVLRSKKPKNAALPVTGCVRRPLMRISGDPKIAPRRRTVAGVVFSGAASETSGTVARKSETVDWPLRTMRSRS